MSLGLTFNGIANCILKKRPCELLKMQLENQNIIENSTFSSFCGTLIRAKRDQNWQQIREKETADLQKCHIISQKDCKSLKRKFHFLSHFTVLP